MAKVSLPTLGISAELVPTQLKQQLLLFDRVAVPNLDLIIVNLKMLGSIRGEKDHYNNIINDLEYLKDKGLIFETGLYHPPFKNVLKEAIDDSSIRELSEILPDTLIDLALAVGINSRQILSRLHNLSAKPTQKRFENWVSAFTTSQTAYSQLLARVTAAQWNYCEREHMVPINPGPLVLPKKIKARHSFHQSPIVEVILKKIPIPNDGISWDQIIEFKNEEKSKGFLAGLRTWCNDLIEGAHSAGELEQRLEWLLFERKQYLAANKIKYSAASVGGAFVHTMEVMEDLVKFRWGKAAKGIVSLYHRKADLLRLEIEGPQKELGYIIRAQEKFGDR